MAGAGVRDTLIGGPWQHIELLANGIRFHLAVAGPDTTERPLVLLLHGFGEFWWAWRSQIPALAEAGFRVAALDLRGYGASDKTPRGYDPKTTALDIAGVIRSLGHRRAVLVGHDWGGMAAWTTLAFAAEQVQAIANIAAPHPLAFPWRHAFRTISFFQLPLLPERKIMADDGAYVEELLRGWAASGSTFLDEAGARHYRDALMLWPSPHCALEYQRMFVRNQFRSQGRAYRQALKTAPSVPLLSVHGQLDPLVPLSAMTSAQRYLTADHQIVDLPEVGHLPHEEAPEALTQILLHWFATIEQADGSKN